MPHDKKANPVRQAMQTRIDAFERNAIDDQTLALAAVAIVVSPSPASGELCFLLTRRAAGLSKHSGQFALPGGRVDAGETSIEAAARELEEELNIDSTSDNIIGTLDDYATRSGFCITPVVFWCDRLDSLRANPGEVAQVFHVPVADLGSERNPIIVNIPESPKPVLSVSLESIDQQIYSPTAAMLHQFHEVLILGQPTRVANYDQPVFAWK